MHDHVERASGELVGDLVESVESRATDDTEEARFRVTPQEGEPVATRCVVAATRYDGEYLRGLDDDAAMFETHDHGGETREHFDREYADPDGTTPIDGLYVASPSEADRQAITAAGRGARVARRVVTDARIDDGWWPAAAEDVDWVRREAEREEEWADRDRWVEWFDQRHADAPVDPESERFARVREAAIDETLASYVDADEAEEQAAEGGARSPITSTRAPSSTHTAPRPCSTQWMTKISPRTARGRDEQQWVGRRRGRRPPIVGGRIGWLFDPKLVSVALASVAVVVVAGLVQISFGAY